MIKIETLTLMMEHYKVFQLCTEAGLNPSTIRSKIKRKTELSTEESEALTNAYNKIQSAIQESMNT